MRIVRFSRLPARGQTYTQILKSLLFNQKNAKTLPSDVYEVENLRIDAAHLARYRQICGFVDDGRVPITYFAVLSQTLQMQIMAKPNFPFAMLGLVHIHNQTAQHRPIWESETARMAVSVDNLRPHDKGMQFDFVTRVFAKETLVWEGVSTYLARQKTQIKSASSTKKTPPADPLIATEDGLCAFIAAPKDLGARYAVVSGDFNPIHLSAFSAKAFGYKRAIAHGMWSKARALSFFRDLPDAYRCSVDFKAPIFLPSTSELVGARQGDGWRFGVYGANEKTHLLGRVDVL